MKYSIALTLFFLSFTVFSQSNFHRGYVVAGNNDTLRGFVDYRERQQNPISVYFQKENNSPVQEFTVSNCAGYAIDEIETYQRFQVDISLSPVELDKLREGVDLSKKRETVFLKLLQRGDLVSLYYYNDDIKERFYILKAGEHEPIELIRHVYLVKNGSGKNVSKRYINQLQLIVREFGVSAAIDEKLLLDLNYDERSLTALVAKINRDQLQKKKSTYPGTRIFAGGGINFHYLTYQNGAAKIMAAPLVNIGVDVFLNPAIRKSVFRAELSYQSSKTQINRKGVGDVVFDQRIVELITSGIYNLYNADDLKFFVGFGAGWTFLRNKSTSNDSSTSNQLMGNEAAAVSFRGVLGVVLYKKLEIGAGYGSKLRLISDSDYSRLGMQRFRVTANYLIGR